MCYDYLNHSDWKSFALNLTKFFALLNPISDKFWIFWSTICVKNEKAVNIGKVSIKSGVSLKLTIKFSQNHSKLWIKDEKQSHGFENFGKQWMFKWKGQSKKWSSKNRRLNIFCIPPCPILKNQATYPVDFGFVLKKILKEIN